MRTSFLFFFGTLFAIAFAPRICLSAPGLGSSSYEELTYEDLVRELSGKKKQVTRSMGTHPFDTIQIHTGLGFLNTISQMKIGSRTLERYQNGLSLSLGIDLFSQNWFAEGVFKNYGLKTLGSEEMTLRELDLLLGYRNMWTGQLGFSLSSGLANRSLRISDPTASLSHQETTPALFFSAGLQLQFSEILGLDMHLAGQSPIVGNSALQTSAEVGAGLRASF